MSLFYIIIGGGIKGGISAVLSIIHRSNKQKSLYLKGVTYE